MKRQTLTIIATTGLLALTASAQTNVAIDGTARRLIGGVGTLDRAQFFNYTETLHPGGGFDTEIGDPLGLNIATGRISTELDALISAGLPEDPTRPGFFDPVALTNRLRTNYQSFVNGSRWQSLRSQENPIVVQSGRNAGIWPQFVRTDPQTGAVHPEVPLNNPAYAEFLSIYLTESLYGPNPIVPLNPDRFYVELMNEPNVEFNQDFTIQDMVDFHAEVTQAIKAVHPTAKVGGPSFCCSDFVGNGFARWNSELKPLIDGAGAHLDFISIHPYDRYTVNPNGSYQRDFAKGAGHTAGQMDLIEAYSSNTLGDVSAMAFTEYGSWNRTDMAGGGYGSYTREQQQWDLSRDIREKLFEFMERPDRIINATPFVQGRHWENGVPTNPSGDNVLYEQDAGGAWSETILGNMFRMYGPVRGGAIDIVADNPDLQSVAYRNGNEVYVLLNNLMSSDQTLNLSALTGPASVLSASLDRIYLSAGTPTFEQGLDVTGGWQSLTLSGEEAAVLTLTLDSSALFDVAYDQTTTYGDVTLAAIDQPGGRTVPITVAADLTDAVSARMRVGYNRPGDVVESFDLIVNGTRLSISADQLALDDGVYEYVVREVDVPLSVLQAGSNTVVADFLGLGGTVGSVVLEIVRSVGDFDDSGTLGPGDLDEVVWAFGSGDLLFDLTGDGSVDLADAQAWIEEVRGAHLGDLDFDGLVNIDDFTMFLQGLHGGDLSSLVPSDAYGIGDVNFDGVGDHTDFVLFKSYYDAVNGAGAFAALIPEPSAAGLTWVATCLFMMRRRFVRPEATRARS